MPKLDSTDSFYISLQVDKICRACNLTRQELIDHLRAVEASRIIPLTNDHDHDHQRSILEDQISEMEF